MKTSTTHGRIKALILASVLQPILGAAAPGVDLVITAGTIVEFGDETYAYVLWYPTQEAALAGQSFTIYQKLGAANARQPYRRVAVVGRQTDPAIIAPLLQRSVRAGEDLDLLEARLDGLFEGLIGAGSDLTLAEKVSVVLRGLSVNDDPDLAQNFAMLARLHPAIKLCSGQAYMGAIPALAQTTFEVRIRNPLRDLDEVVIGRVTVDSANGAPLLPAPGRPVEVPVFADQQGDGFDEGRREILERTINRAVRLRWSTPEALRREPLQSGYHLYRVPKAYAEAAEPRWDQQAPATDPLLAAVATGDAVRVNGDVPILIPQVFPTDQAAQDLNTDPRTSFITDDNGGYRPDGGEPFPNNSKWYYYVTARDYLGRDGLVSEGLLVTICNRRPPHPPAGVEVHNEYHPETGQQRLRISWVAAATFPDSGPISYYLYRERYLAELGMDLPIAGPLPEDELSYLDVGEGAPDGADAGLVFWYAVRAVETTECGENWSGPSQPAAGVIRDRGAPHAPDGHLCLNCLVPVVQCLGTEDVEGSANPDPHFLFICERRASVIAWAEFYTDRQGDPIPGSRRLFEGADQVGFELTLSMDMLEELLTAGAEPGCRVGTRGGAVSEIVPFRLCSWKNMPFGPDNPTVILSFEADVEVQGVLPGADCPDPAVIDPHTGDILGMEVCIDIVGEGVYGLKIYRQIDDGELTLVHHEEQSDPFPPAAEIQFNDPHPPAAGGRVCYFAQTISRDGVHGQLVELPGGCTRVPPLRMPSPMLLPLISAGDEDRPTMQIHWVCPPAGIDHFELLIRTGSAAGEPDFGPQLTPTGEQESWPEASVMPAIRVPLYATGRIAGSLAGHITPPPSQFAIEVPVQWETVYRVTVRAVALPQVRGPFSNIEEGSWEPKDDGPPVPCHSVRWKGRRLPDEIQHESQFPWFDLAPVLPPPHVHRGLAIRIGRLEVPTVEDVAEGQAYPGHINPETGLFPPDIPPDKEPPRPAGPLFPCALYRYRVVEEEASERAADVIQVTPLMEKIAHEFTNVGGERTILHDPFVRIINDGTPGPKDMVLLDTQPVIRGESYRYALVLFDSEGEMRALMRLREIAVPAN